MKKKPLTIRTRNYKTKTQYGYPVDKDQLLWVYQYEGGKEWTVHHNPTGLAVHLGLKSYREAKQFAENILQTTCFDWRSEDPRTFDFGDDSLALKRFRGVGYGFMTADDYNGWLMKRKMEK